MRRPTKKYYFSVEGDTEKWYLEWLNNAINSSPDSKCKVKFNCMVQPDPVKRAKGLIVLNKTEIIHIFDRESEEAVHAKRFSTTLGRMKAAGQLVGKTMKYRLGYSNLTFELWMILHKMDCNGSKTHRRQYLAPINQAYNERFENLAEYKQESNFKRVLKSLTLEDVRQAIQRSKTIMERNEENGCSPCREDGYSYYKENPSLSIWECIEKIMNGCGLMKGSK